MTVIFMLIGISVLLGGGFLVAFFWSVRNGQNEDLYTPSVRMLFEDETKPSKKEHKPVKSKQPKTI
jgi:cbb3-type cytochrome oxidase maturation protein